MEKYSAGLVKKPTFFRESLETAALIYQGLSINEAKTKLIEENILKVTPPRRNVEISSAVLTRLASLSSEQIRFLNNGTLAEKKLMVLLSILKTERLVREFMAEVYSEKLELGHYSLSEADINIFMSHKAEASEDVAKWREITVRKIRQVLKKILKELGLIDIKGKTAIIIPPILSEEIRQVLAGESSEIRRIFIRR